MTSPFTCITCRVAFRDLEIQRQHYKSDWHRYNLKRKVADLPPVPVEEFQRRVIAQRNKDDKEKEEETMSCKKHKEKCAKQNTFEMSSDNADSTLNSVSKKDMNEENSNRQSTEDMEVDSDVESVDSDVWMQDTENPVTNNNCLFCNHHSKTMVRNLKHMTIAHSFFIPDPEYCVDIKGLLTYLGEKIFAGYMCIWCNNSGRYFQSADAVKAHMIDKGHCKMLYEAYALMEYAQFYDYSSSYPDAESSDPDVEVEALELDDSDYQLVLPSGNVIGHRCLMRYYKQNLNPNRALAVSKSTKLHKVLSQYRALGWTETQKEAVVKKVRDIKYMQRVQAKYSTQLQFKANKFQKHFRPQVNY
ncbi:Zinc finger protein 622 [Habropoda laboriosa]|uniref:Zinc finger protein 622 n=1 Tax=Habropoda laboriosa TaxID=597456 RepID=A0A0L7QRF7_9HYME|nr:Zinc finger protein 622 [Habropoda laboriosa]